MQSKKKKVTITTNGNCRRVHAVHIVHFRSAVPERQYAKASHQQLETTMTTKPNRANKQNQKSPTIKQQQNTSLNAPLQSMRVTYNNQEWEEWLALR